MTQQTERDALRKLAEAATPGPWAFGTFHRLLVVQADKHGDADKHSAIADIGAGSIPWDATAESMQEYNDAEYIAAANPAKVIDLLDVLDVQARSIEAIQHYLDQRAKDLPELPPQCEALPKLGESRWDGYERWAKGYGQQCVAHARELALRDAIKQVTILYAKDDYPVLTDICNLIATAK